MNDVPEAPPTDLPEKDKRAALLKLLLERGFVDEDIYKALLNELALEDEFRPIRTTVKGYAGKRKGAPSGLTLRTDDHTWDLDIDPAGALTVSAGPAEHRSVQIPGALGTRARFGTQPPPGTTQAEHLKKKMAVGRANGQPIELLATGSTPCALEIVAMTDASSIPEYEGQVLAGWRKRFVMLTGWGLVPQTVLHTIATRAGEGSRPTINTAPRRRAFGRGALIAFLAYMSVAFFLVACINWQSASETAQTIAVGLDPYVWDFPKLAASAVLGPLPDAFAGILAFVLSIVSGLSAFLLFRGIRRTLRLRWKRTNKLWDYPAEHKLEILGGHNASGTPKIRCHIMQLGP